MGSLVLVAHDVTIFRWFLKVLCARMDGFSEVPVWGKSYIGKACFVLLALAHTDDEAFVVGCIYELIDDRRAAVFGQVV